MIKLLDILKEMRVNLPKLTPLQLAQNRIRDYMKNGGVGDLGLAYTPIRSLPSGLKVRGALSLANTSITSLPPDLKVEGDLFLSGTPLSKSHTEEEIRQMVPGVKGEIYI